MQRPWRESKFCVFEIQRQDAETGTYEDHAMGMSEREAGAGAGRTLEAAEEMGSFLFQGVLCRLQISPSRKSGVLEKVWT